MASFDTFLSEADRMAQGACDGAGTTGPDYVSSGDLIGMGPDSAQHIRTCVHVDEAVMGLSVHADGDGEGDNPLLLYNKER